jgi:hypothetical protein
LTTDQPTDDETISFHQVDGYEPRTRLFLATVSVRDDKGKIYSTGTNNTYEIFGRRRNEGVIDPATRPSPRQCSGQMTNG